LRAFSFNLHAPLDSAPQGPQLLGQHTRFAWSGDQLVVTGPDAAHKRLVVDIDHWRKHSFRQVTIEVRIIQSSRDLCAQDEVDAAATPEDGDAFWKNRWVLFQQDFAAAESTLISQQGASDGLKNSAQAEPANRPLASVTTGTSDPIVYQFLDDEIFRSFLNHCQEDERNPIILAPKITLFDGQTAEISDCSQRPFVTDVTKVVGDVGVAFQPVTKVFWEGTKIQLAPVITPEGHRMKCRFRFASIDDCKTFRSSRYPDAKDVRIQHPVITTASLACAIDIPAGETLLIGGLFPRRVERNLKQGALSRLLGRQPTESVSEVTYIAITPRAVSAEK
jgi:type II secretory pathway component GspD/PulD (secretin)